MPLVNDDITMLYDVAFFTWTQPDPNRLGTAEKRVGRTRVWAKNADEAISEARRVATHVGQEWIATVSADAVTGIILEQIVNDPLNPNAVLKDELTQGVISAL